MSVANFTIKRNDTKPALPAELRDDVGGSEEGPIDLANAEGVKLILREAEKTGTAQPKFKSSCTIIDRSNGLVSYPWVPTDTDTAGNFKGEFEITWKDGGVETVPNNGYIDVTIVEDLG